MLKYVIAALFFFVTVIQMSDVFGDKMLPGTPRIIERDGHPYMIAMFSQYDDDGKEIWTYFTEETCKWMNENINGENVCVPLPEEEQRPGSTHHVRLYVPDLQGHFHPQHHHQAF